MLKKYRVSNRHSLEKYLNTRYSFQIVSVINVTTEKMYHDTYRSNTRYSILIPCFLCVFKAPKEIQNLKLY